MSNCTGCDTMSAPWRGWCICCPMSLVLFLCRNDRGFHRLWSAIRRPAVVLEMLCYPPFPILPICFPIHPKYCASSSGFPVRILFSVPRPSGNTFTKHNRCDCLIDIGLAVLALSRSWVTGTPATQNPDFCYFLTICYVDSVPQIAPWLPSLQTAPWLGLP